MGRLVAVFLLALLTAACGLLPAQDPTPTATPLPVATSTLQPSATRTPRPRPTPYPRTMYVDSMPEADWVNFRAKPSTESAILAEVPDGVRLRTAAKTVRGHRGRPFYPVMYKGHKGYIASVLLSDDPPPKPTSTPTRVPAPLPTATATSQPTLTPTPELVPTSAPTPGAVPYQRTLYVDASPKFGGVNLRARPGIEAAVLAEIPNGTRVFAASAPVKGYQGRAYYPVEYDGQRGFIRATLLRPDWPVAPANTPMPKPTDRPRPTSTPTPAPTATPSEPRSQSGLYQVTNVVDGDTIKIDRDGQITTLRLIGMDTPETKDPRKPVQCFGQAASDRAHTLLDGQRVRIAEDPSQDTRDKYGRLLVYVYTQDGTLYNRRMIRDGYAHEYTYRVPYQLQREFQAAERQAREQGRGLWSPSTCNGDTEQPAERPAATPTPVPDRPGPPSDSNCDPSYPDFCIPPIEQGGDLNCPDIDGGNFTVLPPDPHGFDGRDNDGRGCEGN